MHLPNKFVVDQQFHRVLTWKERWMIFLGYNLQADCTTVVHMRKGAAGKCIIRLTRQATAEDQMRTNAVSDEA